MPEPKKTRPFVWWLFWAVAIHIVLLFLLKPLLREPAPVDRIFAVSSITRTLSPDITDERDIDDARYRPKEEVPDGQVVNAPALFDQRRPDQAKYLSERNNRADRETRSRIRLRGIRNAEPSPSGPGGEGQEPTPGGIESRQPGAPVPHETLAEAPTGVLPRDPGAPEAELKINLKPSFAALNAAIAGTGLDNLDDVEEGDRTFLDTIAWRHATFFNRVKWQVEQYWRPDLEFRRHDPYGNIYGYRDRETVIRVVLHSDGRLFKLYVVSPSGASFLDDEAQRSIRQAAPFPNPPEALKDPKTGIIAFTFAFLVRIDGSPVFRMRRYEGR